jgi:hypothetical protein
MLVNEFKVRIGYLNNLQSSESQQYFHNLVVKYRCVLVQMLENIHDPDFNKSRILKMLHENNMLDFKDLASYNFEDQTKTFL